MKLINKGAEFFIPNGDTPDEAIKKTTHMAIGAHQDDIEIMAYDGIVKCFGSNTNHFFATVVTNGSGSPRADLYADYTDEQMIRVRMQEQKKAAFVGEYAGVALLDYTSADVKNSTMKNPVEDIKNLIQYAAPSVLYTHNLADKHDTHVAVTLRVIAAIRALPMALRPKKLYGVEVWRDLDWMLDEDKVMFDVSAHPNLASALVEIYDSQVCGGKRYDMATIGRRLANATYAASHGTDEADALNYAMDLTALIQDDQASIEAYVNEYMRRFTDDVTQRIRSME